MTLIPVGWSGYAYLNDPYDKNKEKPTDETNEFRDDDIPF
jgi:hypothetical protein